MNTATPRQPRGRERPRPTPTEDPAPIPLEQIEHRHARYEIYEGPEGGSTCWLIGFRHERAYLIEHGHQARLHDTAVALISFGGYPLLERSGAPAALKAALSLTTGR